MLNIELHFMLLALKHQNLETQHSVVWVVPPPDLVCDMELYIVYHHCQHGEMSVQRSEFKLQRSKFKL